MIANGAPRSHQRAGSPGAGAEPPGRLPAGAAGHPRHQRFAERLARFDLHPRHFGMLSQLAASEGESQQALSNALGIHRSAVVALVDDLEQRGLAERNATRRPARLHALPDSPGPRSLAELQARRRRAQGRLLTALNASERSQLISLLQRVAESQGLTAGVHPNLEPQEGDDKTAEKDGATRDAKNSACNAAVSTASPGSAAPPRGRQGKREDFTAPARHGCRAGPCKKRGFWQRIEGFDQTVDATIAPEPVVPKGFTMLAAACGIFHASPLSSGPTQEKRLSRAAMNQEMTMVQCGYCATTPGGGQPRRAA